ncbi:MAG: ferrous iron transport protein A [Clostridia bacterium]|nr:ferrous iron transport protein A [Clostridia bacterium]
MQMTLYDLKIGETALVVAINTDACLKQRLRDIGLIKNSEVKVLHCSPTGNPRAYLIKGSVIALRNCDAEKIIVLRCGDGCGRKNKNSPCG